MLNLPNTFYSNDLGKQQSSVAKDSTKVNTILDFDNKDDYSFYMKNFKGAEEFAFYNKKEFENREARLKTMKKLQEGKGVQYTHIDTSSINDSVLRKKMSESVYVYHMEALHSEYLTDILSKSKEEIKKNKEEHAGKLYQCIVDRFEDSLEEKKGNISLIKKDYEFFKNNKKEFCNEIVKLDDHEMVNIMATIDLVYGLRNELVKSKIKVNQTNNSIKKRYGKIIQKLESKEYEKSLAKVSVDYGKGLVEDGYQDNMNSYCDQIGITAIKDRMSLAPEMQILISGYKSNGDEYVKENNTVMISGALSNVLNYGVENKSGGVIVNKKEQKLKNNKSKKVNIKKGFDHETLAKTKNCDLSPAQFIEKQRLLMCSHFYLNNSGSNSEHSYKQICSKKGSEIGATVGSIFNSYKQLKQQHENFEKCKRKINDLQDVNKESQAIKSHLKDRVNFLKEQRNINGNYLNSCGILHSKLVSLGAINIDQKGEKLTLQDDRTANALKGQVNKKLSLTKNGIEKCFVSISSGIDLEAKKIMESVEGTGIEFITKENIDKTNMSEMFAPTLEKNVYDQFEEIIGDTSLPLMQQEKVEGNIKYNPVIVSSEYMDFIGQKVLKEKANFIGGKRGIKALEQSTKSSDFDIVINELANAIEVSDYEINLLEKNNQNDISEYKNKKFLPDIKDAYKMGLIRKITLELLVVKEERSVYDDTSSEKYNNACSEKCGKIIKEIDQKVQNVEHKVQRIIDESFDENGIITEKGIQHYKNFSKK